MLGNMPQAFSHVPLINTAHNLTHRGGTPHPRLSGNAGQPGRLGGVEEAANR